MSNRINTWSDWIWSTEHKAFYCYLKRPDGSKPQSIFPTSCAVEHAFSHFAQHST